MTAAACGAHDDACRAEIVRLARDWIGTPYLHQASVKGAGTDCLGLIRGVWRELFGAEPEPVPPYTADWAEVDRSERLIAAAARHLVPGDPAVLGAGDVVVMRMCDFGAAKHMGIVSGKAEAMFLIHAYSGHGVLESPLTPAWRRRIVAAFSFPGRA
jgi:NlpC/P60 family putative phage cell wall peptidase